ncbi:type VI secretion system-associated protein [Desulfovibrio sp. An276]|uniref:type VI secretion system contractile sheath small subunit n=1 Tax=Desulfovibrio sp. An276 TaxID=1965618 RepID=UPI000B36E09C|nr:type VI secretion system contractile sheath small subunit [Desulfovibrio sp. An276]OUO50945.1 type VI secretion system-associated protein [Desulfovibrio sp. An276]
MSKEGSVAPKERVNIVYRPATGNVQEDVELPLKLMVVGDFTQRTDDRPIEDRAPVSVDKDNFNDVMKAQGLHLSVNVPNRLSEEEDARMAVNLKFEKMSDFSPDAVAAQVPELAKLLELREALKALKGPLANIPDFRRKLQELVTDDEARKTLLEVLEISDKDEQ